MRRKDTNMLYFFSGTLLISTIITIIGLIIPSSEPGNDQIDMQELIFCWPVFRFVFMLIFGLGLISLDVYILRKYRVNYMFIFGLDPHYKVTHVQLIRVAMMLLTLWMLMFMLQVFISKLEYIFEDPAAWGALVLIVVFVGLCCVPLHVFYLRSRAELLKTLGHIVIAPFGPVKFKDFFLADILTSTVPILRDAILMVFLFASGQWHDIKSWVKYLDPKNDHCERSKDMYMNWSSVEYLLLAVAFVPFWFRLMQCFRRFHETKLVANLKNAGKYFTSMSVQAAHVLAVVY